MRFITLSSLIAMLSVFCITSFAQSDADAGANATEKIGYLLITEPFANVYERLDPMSPLIRQAKKGEYLELVYDGESWHKVKIDGKIGWVEKKSGKIVKNAGGVPVGTVVLLLIVIGATIGGVFYYIQKNRASSLPGADDDL